MINIRTGLFETNSSSVHSMILCDTNDYDAWLQGKKLLNSDYFYRYSLVRDDEIPMFVTPEEAAKYDVNYPYPPAKRGDWDELELEWKDEDGNWHNRKFITLEEYEEGYCRWYDRFNEEYITPKGDEVTCFGYYGRD